ncbi:ribonuclease H-like domain-containing protein [Marinicrinis lubricantis]|uniref:Ribonuclease H-like domain-containing protein n=1 Tax=Marinicrinis lubricantis TaxID=2086470 RepID=A0ABW1ITM4_9BACL
MSRMREKLLGMKRKAISAPEEISEASSDTPADENGSNELPRPSVSENFRLLEAGDEWSAMDVYRINTEWGSFLLRRRVYPLHHRHGYYEFGQLEALLPFLGQLTPEHPPESLQSLAFLDTETTGLGVGAGNLPFMVGLGYYEQNGFVVEQMLLQHPAEEPAMLNYLLGRLNSCSHLISYNGKSFDWPLMKNRFILNRVAEEGESILEHVDFLYPSRNLWRTVLESCRLSHVEQNRLGIARTEDVPGSEAPRLYFEYLAEQKPAILQGVFEHNELDIMGLSILGIHMSLAIAGRLELDEMESEELYRLALWYDKIGRNELREEALRLLLARDVHEFRNQLPSVAMLYKKAGRMSDAVRLWTSYTDQYGDQAWAQMEPCTELAMYYEHKMKQYEVALHYVLLAKEILRMKKSLRMLTGSKLDALKEELNKREQRLKQKRLKASEEQQRTKNRKRSKGNSDVVHDQLCLW